MSRGQIAWRLAVLAAAGCYAFNAILNRWYFELDGEPLTVAVFRAIAAGAGFAAWAVATRRRHERDRPAGNGSARLTRRDLPVAMAVGAMQLAFTSALLLGLDVAPVALVVLLFYVYPLLVTVGAVAFFGERLSLTGVALVVAGSAGIVLAVGTPETVTVAGVAFGLAAGIGNAAVILGNRVLLHRGLRLVDVAAIGWAMPAVAGLALLATGVIPMPPPSAEAWLYAVAFATAGTIVPYVLFYRGVKEIGVSLAALLGTAEPFITILLAYLILGEGVSGLQMLGGLLIGGAVAGLAALPAASRRAAPARWR